MSVRESVDYQLTCFVPASSLIGKALIPLLRCYCAFDCHSDFMAVAKIKAMIMQKERKLCSSHFETLVRVFE